MNEFIDSLKNSLGSIWTEVAEIFPSIAGAILAIIIGMIVIKIVLGIVRKALKFARADKLDDKLNEIDLFDDKKVQFNVIDIVAKFIKWVLYVVLILIVTDILNLTMVSDGIKSILGYLPKLFTALAIFTLGLLFANFIKKSLQSFFESMELSGAKMISQIVFMILLIFVSITALNQAGIDTAIITSNITLVLAAFLLAFAIAFGLGAKSVITNLLNAYYTRKTFEIGQKIKGKDFSGEIVGVDNLSLIVKTENKRIVIPVKEIVENQIEIFD